ncbi:lytic murein transglycosylase B [Thiocystis violacea]|uniref:lytic murein transglycosylase B n=1 Tax=Thiocystis violacea TaxID=13725 RepID=UPI00190850EB|nr:lytic murein transglycosylase B [Thiocystis violacea]MBK1716226.1 lytic murein transglycosylase B [Thiocystis violacea]
MSAIRVLALALALSASVQATEPDDYRAGLEPFIAGMAAEHGFEPASLRTILGRASYRQDIIDAIDRPYEDKSWTAYRQLFLTPERIQGGVDFWRANAEDLSRAESIHGVAPEIIVAILGVETKYGANVGAHRVLDALTTLGFAYPKRADFFRSELAHYLLLTREEGLDPLATLGSYAGAMGKPQFIASSYRAHAVDFDGDGRRDLWNSNADAIGSVANYFKRHGWRPGAPVVVRANLKGEPPTDFEIAGKRPVKPFLSPDRLSDAGIVWSEPLEPDRPLTLIRLDGPTDEYWIGLENFHVVTRYNHSNLYAMAVYQLSQEIRARQGVEP